jgi:hypothetical protein
LLLGAINASAQESASDIDSVGEGHVSSPSTFTGEWLGLGYICVDENGNRVQLDEMVEIRQEGNELIATKILGDRCVGRNEISWIADLRTGELRPGETLELKVQVRDFKSDQSFGPLYWAFGKLEVVSENHLRKDINGQIIEFKRNQQNPMPRRGVSELAAENSIKLVENKDSDSSSTESYRHWGDYDVSSGPTLARHGETLFIAFRSADGSNAIRIAKIRINLEWDSIESTRSIVTNSKTRDPVALASHNGGLWMAFTGAAEPGKNIVTGADPGKNIYIKRIDRDYNERAKKLSFKTSTSPGLVSFNGQLFLFWRQPPRQRGKPENIFWASSVDGISWSKAQSIEGVTDGKFAPAVVVSNDRIHLMFADTSNRLIHLIFDGLSWIRGLEPIPKGINARVSTLKSPKLADANGTMILSTVDNNWSLGHDNQVVLFRTTEDGSWYGYPSGKNSDLRPDVVAYGDRILLATTYKKPGQLLGDDDRVRLSLFGLARLNLLSK